MLLSNTVDIVVDIVILIIFPGEQSEKINPTSDSHAGVARIY